MLREKIPLPPSPSLCLVCRFRSLPHNTWQERQVSTGVSDTPLTATLDSELLKYCQGAGTCLWPQVIYIKLNRTTCGKGIWNLKLQCCSQFPLVSSSRLKKDKSRETTGCGPHHVAQLLAPEKPWQPIRMKDVMTTRTHWTSIISISF